MCACFPAVVSKLRYVLNVLPSPSPPPRCAPPPPHQPPPLPCLDCARSSSNKVVTLFCLWCVCTCVLGHRCPTACFFFLSHLSLLLAVFFLCAYVRAHSYRSHLRYCFFLARRRLCLPLHPHTHSLSLSFPLLCWPRCCACALLCWVSFPPCTCVALRVEPAYWKRGSERVRFIHRPKTHQNNAKPINKSGVDWAVTCKALRGVK